MTQGELNQKKNANKNSKLYSAIQQDHSQLKAQASSLDETQPRVTKEASEEISTSSL